jgi:lipoprotein LenA
VKKIALLFAVVVLFSACKKEGTSQAKGEVLDTKYFKYRMTVFKEPEMKKFLAAAEKGESVALIEELEITDAKNNVVKVAKIRLSDDQEGYTPIKALAKKIVVINVDGTKIFNRNNDSSGVKGKAAVGAIASVSDEKANWLQVELTLDNGKWATGWIKDGFTDSSDSITEAILFERSIKNLGDAKIGKSEKDEALKNLQDIADKGGFLAESAKKALGGGETPSADAGATAGESGWTETPADGQ